MLSEEARRQVEEHQHNRLAWARGERPLVDGRYGANTTGAITEITPGCEIWTVEHGDYDWHQEPLGGIVLSIDPGRPDTVTDDGEIIHHPPRYRCYDPFAPWPHKAFIDIAEPDINPASIAPKPSHELVIAVRRFCRQASLSKHLTLDMGDARLVADAARLVAVIMGDR